jgi:uncharacterized small protein (TIGR04563 family)
MMSDTRKQSLYFPVEVLQQVQEEAIRLDRSLAWVVQRAWRIAREQVATLPGSVAAEPPRRQIAEAP